jgi:predicted AlkP superfamily phosphohydrolase/phosphomutase
MSVKIQIPGKKAAAPPPKARNLLVAGLDGATWDLIGPWAREGRLPLFQKLCEEAACGPLRSVTPNLTPPGWTTAFTGVNPGKHNIFDFFALDKGSENLRVVSSRDRKAPALWEILSSHGVRSGVFNVPNTYPADPVPGFFVTGMGTPGFTGAWAHPEEERERILKEHPAFAFGADHTIIERGDLKGFLDAVYALTECQEKLALDLVARHKPQVLLFVYDDLDRIMHFFWRFMDVSHPRHEAAGPEFADAILSYYRRVEAGILRLRAAMGGDESDLCILSDHGFGPLHTDVFMNGVFGEWGYLQAKPEAGEILKKPLWKKALKKVVPQEARTWVRTNVKASPLSNPLGFIDWQRTKVLYASVSGRSVYLNVRGRQPRGPVPPADYAALRAEVAARILELRDPATGNPVAEAVHTREEVYRGPYVENAPDLLIQEDGRYAYRVDWQRELFAPASQYGVDKSGSHRPDGVLVLHGPSFKASPGLRAKLEDVTPTLLAALKLPIGSEMDGRILHEAFAQPPGVGKADYSQLRGSAGSALAKDEEAQLAERLKGLGYL